MENDRKRKEEKMIGFNVAPFVGRELEYMKNAVDRHKICGDG